MEKKFGNWIVSEDGITWDEEKHGECTIEDYRLLEISAYPKDTYDWLLHVPRKKWMTAKDTLDLNEAFQFAAALYKLELDSDIFKRTLEFQRSIIREKK